ncbi:MAG: hypothetical protein K5654_07405 [Lachnospiraceae bacterium]|nr:hypothetical protein [Lachnospiraceae bacterium]
MSVEDLKKQKDEKEQQKTSLESKRKKIEKVLDTKVSYAWNTKATKEISKYSEIPGKLKPVMDGFSSGTDNSMGTLKDYYVETIEEKQAIFKEIYDDLEEAVPELLATVTRLEELEEEIDDEISRLRSEISSLNSQILAEELKEAAELFNISI